MKNYFGRYMKRERGSILVMVVVAVIILLLIGMGLLTITYGVRLRAIKFKNQTVAMFAAEAGYAQGLFWMNSHQLTISTSIATNGWPVAINFVNSSCNYEVQFNNTYIGGKPVFKIISTGVCGAESRVVEVDVIQNPTGWDMNKCRVPTSRSTDTGVYFADGGIINIPIHINDLKDSPDQRDIYIQGNPRFLQPVSMGESRYSTTNGTDKYNGVMGCFEGGISFDNPDVPITDLSTVQAKLNQFKGTTKSDYIFTPTAATTLTGVTGDILPAVQIELYTDGSGTGKVKITNDCTVVGYQRATTNDYVIDTTGGNLYTPYDIYAYHYKSDAPQTVTIADVAATVPPPSAPGQPMGGQIYVNGNVILGSDTYNQLVVNGKLTIVATGNIWIGDSIIADGSHTTDASGVPDINNPNALGLIAGGVVKVIDPGMSGYAAGGTNNYPGPPPATVTGTVIVNGVPTTQTYQYAPVGNGAAGSNNRVLSTPATSTNPATATVIEAAVTCGGGGWGAENVNVSGTSYGGRKQAGSASVDDLILRGTICEAVRGIVGIIGSDGYNKQYYLDPRLLAGVLPGNIWFGGKFVPAPAGWHDYRP